MPLIVTRQRERGRSVGDLLAETESTWPGSAKGEGYAVQKKPDCCKKCKKGRYRPVQTQVVGRFRCEPALELPPGSVQRCNRCGDSTDLIVTDALLAAYRSALRSRAQLLLRQLPVSMRSLERQLGLSQGYLCRLKSGHGNPSEQLISVLVLLTDKPQDRLGQLRRFWASNCG